MLFLLFSGYTLKVDYRTSSCLITIVMDIYTHKENIIEAEQFKIK